MSTLADYMSTDHKSCDEAFALAEDAVYAGDWVTAESAFNAFGKDMARHFRREEDVLFPAIMNANGPQGPVQVMRMEHAQINELIEQMAASVVTRNAKSYGGLSETLLIVMQQHNLKEEQILYPIADRILAVGREALIDRLKAV
ncbi:MAG: hemerythrin domain-containing protein [Gallionella sp.]|nr:hemerythrin domain-containing protein [Gallionella sp.]